MDVRITTEAVEALERLGVGAAVNELGFLLRSGDGVDKHGEQGWRRLSNHEIAGKLLGHIPSPNLMGRAFDDDSRRLSVAHAAVRCLMLVQRAVEAWTLRAPESPSEG